ncbi:spondin-1 isoform X2 [Agrilus planipennis]|uniref:Spondin-1 n=1 Tax=Agrilus planipennis TaxID=224129 RepID=A0A7F5RAC4_AGRPL|nr:spondin-1 isoform X2 [Agrilus planipennis]
MQLIDYYSGMIFRISITLLLTWFFIQVHSLQCNKKPEGVVPFWSNPHNKVHLEILGNPEGYMPKERYTVKLVAQAQPFTEFLLTVENENGEVTFPDATSSSVGKLDLGDDVLLKFSDKCPNAIMQTNDLPKTEVKVYWIAPEPQSGCVYFKATVVESPRVWYSEEGPLTIKICEATDDGESLPSILERCCACPEAKYEVTFEGLWSRNTHPKDFPEDKWSTKFSDVIGASHSVDYSFWNYGELANDGLRQLAENGNTRELEKELKDNSRHIRTIIKARGISYPNITGKTFAVFRVDNIHHLISLVSMIFPSPDWFVGVSNLELCLRNCSWIESKVLNLYPVDAGIDDGVTYMDRDSPSNPPLPIRQLKSNSPNFRESPFYDESGEPIKPFARIYLSRQRLYEKNCDFDENVESSKPNCELGPWGEWSSCSVTCGKGVQYKQRSLLSNNPEECTADLTMRRVCWGMEENCRESFSSTLREETSVDPLCELTEWGNWSSCSETCGTGTKTRSRRYKNRIAAKRCAASQESPPVLEQNMACQGDGSDCPTELPNYDDCPRIPWSYWSPCLTFCGKGLKVRHRIFDSSSMNRMNPINSLERDEEGSETEDECANIKKVETVECIHEERPICETTSQEPTPIISSESYTVPQDCEVTPWSKWTECRTDASCGEGIKMKFRNIKKYPSEGGKQCGDLVKTKECRIRCSNDKQKRNKGSKNENAASKEQEFAKRNLCEMSKWSAWSPCTQSCGSSAVQQRTRVIIRRNVAYGLPCSERVEERSCNLLPCND